MAGRQSLCLLDLTTGRESALGDVQGSIEDVRWDRGSTSVIALVADPEADLAGSEGATRLGGGQDPTVIRPGAGGRRLVQIDLDQGLERRVSPVGQSVWEFDWSGGDTLVALVSEDPTENGWYDAAVVEIDVAAGTAREAFRSDLQLSCPRISADGRRIAVIEGLASDRGLVAGSVALLDAQTAGATGQLGTLEDVTAIDWREDGGLWCVGRRGLECTLGTLSVDGSYEEVWGGGALLGNHFQPSVAVSRTGVVAAVYQELERPPEVAVLRDGSPRAWRAVSNVNAHLADRVYRPQAQRLAWEGSDGLEIEGLLLRPAQARGLLPMIVVVHGGPTWAWSHEYAPFDGRAPLLAEAGYAVLLPNPRGSTGRGHRFVSANVGDLGGADLGDILAGVDACVASGEADPSRIGIIGLSYGGFMTAWAVTQTDRFAAAVAMSCISDWVSYHYTSNVSRFDELFLTGDVKDPTSHYYQRSPILLAHNARTPTLVISGERDLCTPVGQAHELYAALREAGVETELVTYPREGHWPTEYDHQVDAWDRVRDWFDQHLRPAENSPTATDRGTAA